MRSLSLVLTFFLSLWKAQEKKNADVCSSRGRLCLGMHKATGAFNVGVPFGLS